METIGVDLGGTKMLVGVVNDDGTVLYERTAASIGLSQEELIETLVTEVAAARQAHPRVDAVGLGIPCTIDRDRGVAISAVNLPIRDLPIRDLIADRTGMAVAVDNDGNVAALAEHEHGAAKGTRNAVLATVGTGIGGGLILDGKVFRGSSGAGAELGHTVIDHNGPKCQGSCPNHGCVEVLASGTALGLEGGSVDGKAVTQAAIAGDEGAVSAVATIGRRLGAAMSTWANIFDPDVIVVGGGVAAGAGELLIGPARDELRERALPPMNEVSVVAAELGARAGMIGAAVLADQEAGV